MNYANILHGDILNGEDYGIAFFPCGCSLRCVGCQNYYLWDKNAGIPFDEKAKNEIFEALEKDYNHRFSLVGGHAFEDFNIKECTQLCKEIKEKHPDIKIWAYTGRLYEDIKDLEIFNYIDILVDGPYIITQNNPNKLYAGSDNQRVIDVKETIKQNKVILHCE